MSDQAISSMYVLLGLNTVDFEKGAADASKAAQRTAGDIDKSFGSVAEGKGGLMLTEEVLGFRFPRHLNSLLAKIPGVASAFSAMLPIAGAIVAGEIITKLIEKHEALAIAIRKAAVDTANLTIKEGDQVKSLELTNLKLDDQIEKLSGGVKTNRLKEALIEDQIAVDNLAARFTAEFQKIDDEILKTTNFTGMFGMSMSAMWQNVENLFKKGTAKIEIDKVQQALKDVDAQMRLVNGAQVSLSEAKGPEELAERTKALATQMDFLKTTASAAMDAIQTSGLEAPELMGKLSQVTVLAANGYKSLGLEAESASKRAVVANLTELDEEMKGLARYKKIHEEYIKARKEQANKNEKVAEEEAHSETEANNAFHEVMARNMEDGIKRNEELQQSYSKLAEEQSKLAAKAKVSSVDNQASLGLINAREEQKELKAIYQTESNDLKAHFAADKAELQAYISQQQAQAAASIPFSTQQITALDNATKGQLKLNDATKAYDSELAQVNGEISKLDTSLKKDQASWNLFFAQMRTGTKDIGIQIRENLQGSIDKAVTAFSTGFAKMTVEGKSFGAAMKALGQQIAESFISMITEMAIKYLLSLVTRHAADKIAGLSQIGTQAAVAGAGGVASMAAAPFPMDMGAPAFGAAMFADAFSYAAALPASQGALIGGSTSTGTHVIAHGKELILPAHISDGLQAMIAGGSKGHTFNIDARGAQAGVSQEIHRAMQTYENRAVARSVSAVNDRASRRT